MNSKTKLIFIVTIGIIMLVAVIFLLIFYKKPERPKTPMGIKSTASIPANIAQVVDIAKAEILFPSLLEDRTISYLSKDRPLLKTIEIDSLKISETADIDKILEQNLLQKIVWSPSHQKVIFKIVNNSNNGVTQFLFFDLKTKKSNLLNSNIVDIIWVNENQILYSYFNPKTSQFSISISAPDGSNWKEILKSQDALIQTIIGFNQAENKVIFGGGDVENRVFVSNFESGKIEEIFQNYSLFTTDQTSTKVAFVSFNEPDQITIINVNNPKEKKDYPIGYPIKNLVFGQKKLIIIAKGKDQLDEIYLLDAEEQQITKLEYESKNHFDAQNLMPTRDGKTLYFTSDDLLYRIDIGTGNEG